MHLAARTPYLDITSALLSHGASVNITDNLGRTPMHKAIQFFQGPTVIKLFENKADINIKDKAENSFLSIATEHSAFFPLILNLMEKGAKFEPAGKDNWIPLHYALQENLNEEIALKILNHTTNPNSKDIHGNTPLMFAVNYKYKTIVTQLLKKNVDINMQNTQGVTALYLAVDEENDDIILNLLNHGADPYLKTNYGYSAYDFAKVKSGKTYEIFQTFKKKQTTTL